MYTPPPLGGGSAKLADLREFCSKLVDLREFCPKISEFKQKIVGLGERHGGQRMSENSNDWLCLWQCPDFFSPAALSDGKLIPPLFINSTVLEPLLSRGSLTRGDTIRNHQIWVDNYL